jgi:sporulation protein YlmC with PRC-barrel domain
MKHTTLLSTATVGLCLAFGAPVRAAPAPSNDPPPDVKASAVASPAKACLADVQAFDMKMQKDGYWFGGSSYGFGYPMDELGYGYPYTAAERPPQAGADGFHFARPGYELRVLLSSATILAQNGQQQPCEAVLAISHKIYGTFAARLHESGLHASGSPEWQQAQIARAKPVMDSTIPFRSSELIDTDVRSAQNEALGSVHDIVMSPKTGKIAYVIVGRGGLFGIDEKFVPVPWDSFKVTQNGNLLVLDTTKAIMTAAPQITRSELAKPGDFDRQSQKIDSYWTENRPVKAAAK